jgi:hypothetical protein
MLPDLASNTQSLLKVLHNGRNQQSEVSKEPCTLSCPTVYRFDKGIC